MGDSGFGKVCPKTNDLFMKLIVGLGNPGAEYDGTRHNVGYGVIDELQKLKLPARMVVKRTGVFMNSSGDAVKKLVDFYKVGLDDLWVVHDDLDIALGAYKIQMGKGPKDHKGIASIEERLGEEFWRVRVGVENRGEKVAHATVKISGEEYVLQKFSEEEKKVLEKVVLEICKKLAKS